jgi:hypothetical protein
MTVFLSLLGLSRVQVGKVRYLGIMPKTVVLIKGWWEPRNTRMARMAIVRHKSAVRNVVGRNGGEASGIFVGNVTGQTRNPASTNDNIGFLASLG